MAIQLNTADYAGLNNSINELLATGTVSGVLMSVYSDEGATILVSDEHGSIENRQISGVSVVYSYVNQETGENINGHTTVKFTDGSSIISTDNVDQHWYVLSSIPYAPRRFGNA